jgi:hypothetical protein
MLRSDSGISSLERNSSGTEGRIGDEEILCPEQDPMFGLFFSLLVLIVFQINPWHFPFVQPI